MARELNRRRAAQQVREAAAQAGCQVGLAFKHIRYSEGDQSLVFAREAGGATTQATIWVPSPRKWRETMPDWAKERRAEILARVWAHAAHHEWVVSYAKADSMGDDDLSFIPR